MSKKIGICFFLISCVAQAQMRVSLISDIDDTLKISEVRYPLQAARRLYDGKSYFLGMRELFQGILQNNPATQISYVTAGPAFLVTKTHLEILQNFPAGPYYPRNQWSKAEHKLQTIRQILNQQKPQLVLFFGDNADGDPLVYKQIENEYSVRGVQFRTYIRINYALETQIQSDQDPHMEVTPPQSGQMGYVTPVEIGIDLFAAHLLSSKTAQWINDSLVPAILREPSNLTHGVIAIPNFVDCQDFRWPFPNLRFNSSIEFYKEKIQKRCAPSVRKSL